MTTTLTPPPVDVQKELHGAQLPARAPLGVVCGGLLVGAALYFGAGINLMLAALVVFAVNFIARWIVNRRKEFSGAN